MVPIKNSSKFMWPVLFALGILGSFLAVFGPRLGLGINETFFFYQLTGIDRSTMLVYALAIFLVGAPLFLISYPNFLKLVGLSLAALGVALFMVNIYGFTLGADIYPKMPAKLKNQILGGEKTYIDIKSLDRNDSELVTEYITRVTLTVHNGVYHKSDWVIGENPVPIFENWVLWFRQFFNASFRDYEFHNPQLAAKRGYGLCSQLSLMITNTLEKNNIRTKMIGLGEHVLATAEVSSGKWYLVDGDYGVVVPHSFSEVENNTSLARPFYENVGAPDLHTLFDPKGNVVIETKDYRGDLRRFENISYLLKWILPAFFIFGGIIMVRTHKRFVYEHDENS